MLKGSAQKDTTLLIWILSGMMMVGPFTIDLYLPAFPQMQQDLQTTAVKIQLTLTGTTLGFALGQLFVGPLSDKIGRRTPLLFSAALHAISCLLAVFAPNIVILSIARVLQGVAAASSTVVARAAVRDLFEGNQLVKTLGRLALLGGIAPLVAPVLGSQLLLLASWRGLFVFLTLFGTFMFFAVLWKLPETLPAERRKEKMAAFASYKYLLSDRKFLGTILAGGFITATIFVYLASASFVFQDSYGLNAQQFGLLFTTMSIGTFLGMQAGSRLVQRFGAFKTLLYAVSFIVVACITMVVAEKLTNNMFATTIPLWFAIFHIGMCFICFQVLSLENHASEAGAASALMGSTQFGFSAIVTPLAGLIGLNSAAPMAGIMLVLALLALASIVFLMKPGKKLKV